MLRIPGCCLALGLALAAAGRGDDPADPKDPKNWTAIPIAGKQKAPEFEDVSEWVNGPPLTMKGLKGQVVVVHFMAFG